MQIVQLIFNANFLSIKLSSAKTLQAQTSQAPYLQELPFWPRTKILNCSAMFFDSVSHGRYGYKLLKDHNLDIGLPLNVLHKVNLQPLISVSCTVSGLEENVDRFSARI